MVTSTLTVPLREQKQKEGFPFLNTKIYFMLQIKNRLSVIKNNPTADTDMLQDTSASPGPQEGCQALCTAKANQVWDSRCLSVPEGHHQKKAVCIKSFYW